jgi:hypothetical protein
LSSSEVKEYDDQIVIVDGLGISHFIPRRSTSRKAQAEKGEKGKK